MAKVSVIGAGNVGASCVEAMLHLNFCSEIVLLDIK
ncbi:MAG: malate dehydrogenase, partial [Bacteroidales bacterium]|nr:malate dehydrogenase [Bacteroidales bacterium]